MSVKRLAKILFGVVGIGLIALLAVYLQDARFWDRYLLLSKHKGVLPQEGWSDSEFLVEGAPQHAYFEEADSASRTISEAALEEVSRYASERKSTSLLVWHKGQLQFLSLIHI